MSFKIMKQKYHLISSIISMAITSVLLIVVCLAWYVTNKEAYVTGVTGSIVDEKSVIESIEYYDVTNRVENNDYTITYTFGDKSTKNANNLIDMGPYDPMAIIDTANGELFPQKLMVITLKESGDYTLTADSQATSYLGETIKINDTFVLSETGPNSLTSVIGFYYLNFNEETITDSSTTVNLTDEIYFVDIENNEITKNITLGSTNGSNKIYILFDYYEESIEHIYSLNIGNPALNVEDGIEEKLIPYDCDFKLSVK